MELTCPSCGAEIASAIRSKLESEVRSELDRRFLAQIEGERAQFEAQQQEQRRRLEEALEEARSKSEHAVTREAEVARRERELAERSDALALDLEQRLAAERQRIKDEADRQADARHRLAAEEAIRAKDEELVDARRRADQATAREADVAKRERELAERSDALALELERQLAAERQRIREDAERQADARHRLAAEELLRAKEEELVEARGRAEQALVRETEIARREREVDERSAALALDLEQRLAAERTRIREEAEHQAEARHRLAAEDVLRTKDEELKEARRRADEAARKEADILERGRALDERAARMQLEQARQVNTAAEEIRQRYDELLKQQLASLQEAHALRDQEQREREETLKRQLAAVQQKLLQGSQQVQGEAQETLLREILERACLDDDFEEVGKGINGADVVHHVADGRGGVAGKILWESKRTKGWSAEWLAKLRDDQRSIGATCAVLVTQVLPEGVVHFGLVDGVWVCGWSYASAIASVLRHGLVQAAAIARSAQGRGEKMVDLYNYLTTGEFVLRFKAFFEVLQDLEKEIAAEERAMRSRWARRRKALHRASINIAAIHGDLQGIAGDEILDIPELTLETAVAGELDSGDASDDDLDDPDSDERDGLGPPAPQAELVELLFALLPENGTAIGNIRLSETFATAALTRLGLTVDRESYDRCRDLLVLQRRARRGQGRGGSIARVVHAEVR